MEKSWKLYESENLKNLDDHLLQHKKVIAFIFKKIHFAKLTVLPYTLVVKSSSFLAELPNKIFITY